MEAKLAEFRKKNAPKKALINYNEISSRFSSIFSSSSNKKSHEETPEEEEKESQTNWQILLLKCLLWLTLLIIFIRLEFGTIYFVISLLYCMWTSMDSRRRRRRNELSAYSVFNPNFEKIQGTFSAEDYDRQLRRGGSPLFSS